MKRIIVIVLILILNACSNTEESVQEPAPELREPEVVEQEQEDEKEEEKFPYTYPLTGIGTEEQNENRVVGVTVNNHPAARPQSGLIDADIVYELLAEGEMTRFVALYHSTYPETVGPVRSTRPYFIDLVKGYNGMLVTHGWSPEAERLLQAGRADFLNGLYYDGTLFQRSSERKAPHNSYITFANIFEGLNERGYDVSGDVPSLDFYDDEEEQIVGERAEHIQINYLNQNIVDYKFHAESGLYERFNGEIKLVDYDTDEPIRLANLLVIETRHEVIDDVGRRAIHLTTGGDALLFQDGIVQELHWENRNGQLIPVKDGEPVSLKKGQTWINIVPTSPSMKESVTYGTKEEAQ